MKTKIAVVLIASAALQIPAEAEIFTYSAVGELTKAVAADGSSTKYNYDSNGNLLTVASSLPLAFGKGKNFTITIPGLPGQTITANLSSIGGGSSVALNDSGTGGDQTAGDGTWSVGGTVGSGVGTGTQLVEVITTNPDGSTTIDYVPILIRPTGNPTWWTASGTSILTPGGSAANYAPANLGQLKYVAKRAKAYLDTKLPANAQKTAVETLLASFGPDNGTAYTPGELAANYAPANIGQLKAVAKPFYDWLISAGYDSRAQLIARGMPNTWTSNYPWSSSTPPAENYVPANLGQLKMVFSFDLE
jgi:YD repeat-containing protein